MLLNDLGWRWTAYGDGDLDKKVDKKQETRTSQEIIEAAVKLGCDDIRASFDLGVANRDKTTVDAETSRLMVRVKTQPPALVSNKYGPEQLMPRIAAGQEMVPWERDSLAELWDAIAPGGKTVGSLLAASVDSDGPLGEKLDATLTAQAYEIDLTFLGASTGSVYPQNAFREAVLDRLRASPGECLAFLLEVVDG